MIFGVVFPGKSYVLTSEAFEQTGPANFVLDLGPYVGADWRDAIQTVCVFLPQPPPGSPAVPTPDGTPQSLSVYVQSPGCSEWEYRGAIGDGMPSGLIPLRWPAPSMALPAAPSPRLGIAIEPAAVNVPREAARSNAQLAYAKAVATDLFRYMQSFLQDDSAAAAGVLTRWFARFEAKFRNDPSFLDHASLD